MAVIYRITNMMNDKYYIGSSQSFERRVWQHKNELKKGVHKNPKLQAAWNKYGEDAFVFEIIETVSDDRQLQVEDTYLMQCIDDPLNYNINRSAELSRLGIKLSDEAKQNISVGRKGKHAGEEHYRYGREVSEETRKKIGDTQRGVKKGPRTFSEDGLRRAQENMKRNAKEQKPLDFEAVKAKFPQVVQDMYDFSKAEYTGALERITGCRCPHHGEFSQYAAQFRKGRGCPSCGAEQRAESKSKQMKDYWNTNEGREAILNSRTKTVDTQKT